MNILFVTARFPYPPVKGDKIISYQRLKHFSRKHDISLLSFAERQVEPDHISAIRRYCRQIDIIPLRKTEALFNMLLKGLSDVPLQILLHKSRRFKAKLEELQREHKYDLIHVFMLRIASYISDYNDCPKIIELIDSMELNMRRRASLENNFKRWLFSEEARRLSLYEKTMVRKFDQAVVVSQIDKELIGQDNIAVSPLGVDTETFYPLRSTQKDRYLIMFGGNMGYFPNEKAVLYFADELLPLVQKRIPKARFWIVGGGATGAVKQLEKKNEAIRVLGFVDSMPDYINKATVSVCPMQSGSGMQFKVLEALACGVPVVATSLAKGNIELNESDGLFVADDPAVFADRIVEIMKSPDLQIRARTKAPQAVKLRYSWERSNLIVENIYSKLVSNKDGHKCEKL